MDFNTKIQDNTAAVQSSAGSNQIQTTGAGNSSAPNTVFDTKSSTSQINEELLKKILEKYPEFLTRTQEEQAKILDEFNNIGIINSNPIEQQTEMHEEENKIKSPVTADNQSDLNKQSDEFLSFNHAEYSISEKDWQKLTEEKKQQYIDNKLAKYYEELAKNRYLYRDSKNKKTLEDWENLSKEEKANLVANTSDTKLTKKILKASKFGLSKYLDSLMLELQAANSFNGGISIDDLRTQDNKPEEYQGLRYALHEYIINKIQNNDKTLLSGEQLRVFEINSFSTEAVQNHFKDKNIDYTTRTQEELYALIKKEYPEIKNDTAAEIKLKEIELEYSKQLLSDTQHISKEQRDKLNKRITLLNKQLDRLNLQYKTEAYSTEIWDEFKFSEFGEVFNAEQDTSSRVNMLEIFLDTKNKEKTKGEALDNSLKLIQALCSNKSWDEAGIIYHKLAKQYSGEDLAKAINPNYLQVIIMSAEKIYEYDAKNSTNLLSGLFDKYLGDTGYKFEDLQNLELDAIEDKEVRKKLEFVKNTQALATKNYSKEQVSDAEHQRMSIVTGNSEALYSRLTQQPDKEELSEAQKLAAETVVECGNSDANEYFTKNVGQFNTDAQEDAFNTLITLKSNAITATREKVVSTLDAGNQLSAFNNLRIRTEQSDIEKDLAISLQSDLADQIQDCDQTNQLAMHESIMQSEYSEVREHAAGNIHNYHESVQADAYRATIATGDEHAIDAANNQYSQMAQSAQQETASEYQSSSLSESYDSQTNQWSSTGTDVRQGTEAMDEIIAADKSLHGGSETQFTSESFKSNGFSSISDAFSAFKNKEISFAQLKDILNRASDEDYRKMLLPMIQTGAIKSSMLKFLIKSKPDLFLSLLEPLISMGKGSLLLDYIKSNTILAGKVLAQLFQKGSATEKIAAAKLILKSPSEFPKELVQQALEIKDNFSYAFTVEDNSLAVKNLKKQSGMNPFKA